MHPLLEIVRALPPATEYALYGAGRYARAVFESTPEEEFFSEGRFLLGVIDDGEQLSCEGFPCAKLGDALSSWRPQAVIVATDTHQRAMLSRLHAARFGGRVECVPSRFYNAENTARRCRDAVARADTVTGLPSGARVLVAGCGDYFPVAAVLAARGFDVTAIDNALFMPDPRFFDDEDAGSWPPSERGPTTPPSARWWSARVCPGTSCLSMPS
ncbi:MAG: hypothetical protein M5R36_18390 [Deltaproteobacteria bacterium]|nr:hypothetical protein [Deltaproteobacteria bacterium]